MIECFILKNGRGKLFILLTSCPSTLLNDDTLSRHMPFVRGLRRPQLFGFSVRLFKSNGYFPRSNSLERLSLRQNSSSFCPSRGVTMRGLGSEHLVSLSHIHEVVVFPWEVFSVLMICVVSDIKDVVVVPTVQECDSCHLFRP